MVAVVVHAIGFRLDAERDGLRRVVGKRNCHLAAPSLVGQRQRDCLTAVGNAVGYALGVNCPSERTSGRDVGGNDGISHRAAREVPRGFNVVAAEALCRRQVDSGNQKHEQRGKNS